MSYSYPFEPFTDWEFKMNLFNKILNRVMIPKYDFIEKIVVCKGIVNSGTMMVIYHPKNLRKLTNEEKLIITGITVTLYRMVGYNPYHYSGVRFIYSLKKFSY
jgi:hypothetical protein